MNFRQFVETLAIFRPVNSTWGRGTPEQQDAEVKLLLKKKLECWSLPRARRSPSAVLFRLYDVNNDGFVDAPDLVTVLQQLVGDNMSAAQLQAIAAQTMAEANVQDSRGLALAEFEQVPRRHVRCTLIVADPVPHGPRRQVLHPLRPAPRLSAPSLRCAIILPAPECAPPRPAAACGRATPQLKWPLLNIQ